MNRDRGQVILITGLLIAVMLVTLVLLLNAAIYTENVATRGVDSGGNDAIEYRTVVVGSAEELIERENERFDEGDPLDEAIAAGIGTVDEEMGERYLQRGTVAEVRISDIAYAGTVVWQNETGEFESADEEPESDWTVATDVNETERFILTIDEIEEESQEEPFRVVIDDWTMSIYSEEPDENDGENGNGDGGEDESEPFEIVVELDGENGEIYREEVDLLNELDIEIDIIEDEINGESEIDDEPVEIDLPTFDGDDIRFENGNAASGTFELVVDGDAGDDEGEGINEAGDETGPYHAELVSSVDLDIHFQTPTLEYSASIDGVGEDNG